MNYCYYHKVDLDGWFSAAIVKKFVPDCELRAFNYGDPMPLHGCGDQLYVVDISFPARQLLAMLKDGVKVVWCDHHISAIKDFEALRDEFADYQLDADRKPNIHLYTHLAACEITWSYFAGGNPELSMPAVVKLIGSYDAWRNADKQYWDLDVMPFQMYMRLKVSSPEGAAAYLDMDAEHVDAAKTAGKILLQYQQSMDKGNLDNNVFMATIQGQRTVCVNSSTRGSSTFDSMWDPDKHDMMCIFCYCGKAQSWSLSFYSVKADVDCSTVARYYGGGGHRGAAGCRLKDIGVLMDLRYTDALGPVASKCDLRSLERAGDVTNDIMDYIRDRCGIDPENGTVLGDNDDEMYAYIHNKIRDALIN